MKDPIEYFSKLTVDIESYLEDEDLVYFIVIPHGDMVFMTGNIRGDVMAKLPLQEIAYQLVKARDYGKTKNYDKGELH